DQLGMSPRHERWPAPSTATTTRPHRPPQSGNISVRGIMVQESIRRHRGIAIYSGDQSVNSIEASRFEMFRRGLYLDLFHYARRCSRRLWRYWKAPLEDARIIVALASRPYDFVRLCGGDEHMRRPHLLRLILT